ncbi:MAG: 50S ribosomal protein L11 [Planctomycetota bacterium]
MAKKKVTAEIKLQVTGGSATPAPPIGPTLSPHGVNIMQFVQQFNERTKDIKGVRVPVIITVYSDKSFTFIIKTPPAAILLKQALKLEKGSPNPKAKKVGSISRATLRELAEKKAEDLTAHSIEAAMKTLEGTARSMGVKIEE